MYNIKSKQVSKETETVMNRLPKSFTDIKIGINAKGLTYVKLEQIRVFVELSKALGMFEAMKAAKIGLLEAVAIQHELNK